MPSSRKPPPEALNQDPEALRAIIRERAPFPQAELARRLGVLESTMSDYVNGGRNMPYWRMNQAAHELGCERSEFERKPERSAA